MLYFVYQQKKSYNLSPPANGTVCHLQLWLRRTRTITLLSFLPIFLMVETQLGSRRSGTVSLVAGTVILLHHSRLAYRMGGSACCPRARGSSWLKVWRCPHTTAGILRKNSLRKRGDVSWPAGQRANMESIRLDGFLSPRPGMKRIISAFSR